MKLLHFCNSQLTLRGQLPLSMINLHFHTRTDSSAELGPSWPLGISRPLVSGVTSHLGTGGEAASQAWL